MNTSDLKSTSVIYIFQSKGSIFSKRASRGWHWRSRRAHSQAGRNWLAMHGCQQAYKEINLIQHSAESHKSEEYM